jgi:hypothetical protein
MRYGTERLREWSMRYWVSESDTGVTAMSGPSSRKADGQIRLPGSGQSPTSQFGQKRVFVNVNFGAIPLRIGTQYSVARNGRDNVNC